MVVLVARAARQGATLGIAERVAARLCPSGIGFAAIDAWADAVAAGPAPVPSGRR